MINLYTKNLKCGNTEPHDSHPHPKTVTVRCSGHTACGERLHEPHEFQEEQSFWCSGICGCGATHRGLNHGPGDHK